MLLYLIIFFISIVSTFMLMPFAGSLGFRRGIVDNPGNLTIHALPVPRTGGVAMFLGFLITIGIAWLSGLVSSHIFAVIGIFFGASFFFIAGLFDDIHKISPLEKFLIEIIGALLAVSLDIKLKTFPVVLVGSLLGIFYLIGGANALNLLDGMDGLAAGISAIAAVFMAIQAIHQSNFLASVLALSVLGVSLGFLPYNLNIKNPLNHLLLRLHKNFLSNGNSYSKIFMGDSGSLFLGYALSCTAILLASKASDYKSFMAPLLVLSIPLLDTGLALARRLINRADPFTGDRRHIYDIMVSKGLNTKQTVGILCSVTLLLGILSIAVVRLDSFRTFCLPLGLGLIAVLGVIAVRLGALKAEPVDEKSEFIRQIPLSGPDIGAKEIALIKHVLNTPYLSRGPMVERFEDMFAEYLGIRYAVAVNSGTSGLHLGVIAAGIKEGDEVITSPFSFVASANCLLYERARPVFVDIDPGSLNIDTDRIEEKITPRTKAILPVHVFGCPCHMDRIMDIAGRFELRIIEDACEAIGAEYRTNGEKWRKAGTFGDCGVFAFYPNKQITTGEGGMVVTNNKHMSKIFKCLRNQGRPEGDGWLGHERLGFNYRISDINCALGIAQLERIDPILKKREKVAAFYNEKLADVDELMLPRVEIDKKISWFVYVVRLADKFSEEDRDWIVKKLREKGINCGKYFPAIHLQPYYVEKFGYKKGDFPIAEKISERTISLPFYNNLSEDMVEYIVKSLKEILAGLRP
jgi:perosamine synthetase